MNEFSLEMVQPDSDAVIKQDAKMLLDKYLAMRDDWPQSYLSKRETMAVRRFIVDRLSKRVYTRDQISDIIDWYKSNKSDKIDEYKYIFKPRNFFGREAKWKSVNFQKRRDYLEKRPAERKKMEKPVCLATWENEPTKYTAEVERVFYPQWHKKAGQLAGESKVKTKAWQRWAAERQRFGLPIEKEE